MDEVQRFYGCVGEPRVAAEGENDLCIEVTESRVEAAAAHCCLAPCKSVTNYGPLTEPKFYIVKSALTPIPTSNGHISETKRDSLDPLVPKFFSRRGLSPTLS